MTNKILNRIKALPPLPKTVMEVQRITNDPDASIADLVKVIKQDPMLTANLLKVANSPLYGFAKEIKSVDQAVSLFGMTTIKGFVISFSIRNSMKFDLSAYGISENDFHYISMKRNALAFNWYRGMNKYLDIISTNAFLLDVGAVIISLILVSENNAEEFKNKLTKENRYALEKQFIGANTIEINCEIFKHWHFGKDLVISMGNLLDVSNAKEYKIESASLDVIKTIYNILGFEEEDIQKGIKKAEEYSLDVNKLKKAIDIVQGS